MSEILKFLPIAGPIVTLVLGVIVCFGGFRLLRASVTCLGAFVGYELGSFLTGTFSRILAIEIDHTSEIFILLLCAVILGITTFAFYKKAIIYIVTFATMTSATKIFGGNVSTKYLLISLGVGLALGCLAYMIQKMAIMLITAYGGAYIIAMSIMSLILLIKPVSHFFVGAGSMVIGDVSLSLELFIRILLTIFFLVAGFIAQIQKK